MQLQNILLVEDDLTLGELLCEVLAKTGHGSTWFVRARFSAGHLVLMDIDGLETAIDASRYELALVDWRLKGSEIDGPEVTSYLVARNLPVVGISGLGQLNDQIVKAGARGGITKDELFSRLIGRTVVIDKNFRGA